jgi:hypothetical protein
MHFAGLFQVSPWRLFVVARACAYTFGRIVETGEKGLCCALELSCLEFSCCVKWALVPHMSNVWPSPYPCHAQLPSPMHELQMWLSGAVHSKCAWSQRPLPCKCRRRILEFGSILQDCHQMHWTYVVLLHSMMRYMFVLKCSLASDSGNDDAHACPLCGMLVSSCMFGKRSMQQTSSRWVPHS